MHLKVWGVPLLNLAAVTYAITHSSVAAAANGGGNVTALPRLSVRLSLRLRSAAFISSKTRATASFTAEGSIWRCQRCYSIAAESAVAAALVLPSAAAGLWL